VSSGGFWPGDRAEAREVEVEQAAEPGVAAEPEVEPASTNGDAPEESAPAAAEDQAAAPEPEPVLPPPGPPAAEPEPEPEPDPEAAAHAPGELDVPDDVAVLEGSPDGGGRSVAVVVSRFNGEVTNAMLAAALEELEQSGVGRDRITIMPVPGAFELPLGAMALAKTRRFACVVALGCVIRGETAHFDYVAGEAASGLQLAALETGVPVAFGVLTVDTPEQARERVGRAADAVRSALEMADIFHQLRAQAKSG
jgi:6,7-dimethyl-8-ribityllumazine synthase